MNTHKTSCEHEHFRAEVDVHRLTNNVGTVSGYNADIRIQCEGCGRRMQFIGLPSGFDTRSATVSIDGLEAHLAMVPEGSAVSDLGAIAGYFRNGNANA